MLLSKWKWRILNEEGTLWCQILRAKYGDLHKAVMMRSDFKPKQKALVWWKDMLAANLRKTNLFDCFAGNINFSLGKGDSFLFWYSRWIRGPTLKFVFPILFNLSRKPIGQVCDMGNWIEGVWPWNLHVNADDLLGNSTAIEEAFLLIELLTNRMHGILICDLVKWWPNADRLFSVKSCYSSLRDRELEDVVEPSAIAVINNL